MTSPNENDIKDETPGLVDTGEIPADQSVATLNETPVADDRVLLAEFVTGISDKSPKNLTPAQQRAYDVIHSKTPTLDLVLATGAMDEPKKRRKPRLSPEETAKKIQGIIHSKTPNLDAIRATRVVDDPRRKKEGRDSKMPTADTVLAMDPTDPNGTIAEALRLGEMVIAEEEAQRAAARTANNSTNPSNMSTNKPGNPGDTEVDKALGLGEEEAEFFAKGDSLGEPDVEASLDDDSTVAPTAIASAQATIPDASDLHFQEFLRRGIDGGTSNQARPSTFEHTAIIAHLNEKNVILDNPHRDGLTEVIRIPRPQKSPTKLSPGTPRAMAIATATVLSISAVIGAMKAGLFEEKQQDPVAETSPEPTVEPAPRTSRPLAEAPEARLPIAITRTDAEEAIPLTRLAIEKALSPALVKTATPSPEKTTQRTAALNPELSFKRSLSQAHAEWKRSGGTLKVFVQPGGHKVYVADNGKGKRVITKDEIPFPEK